MQGENMSDLDNEKVIKLVQEYLELYLGSLQTYWDVKWKADTWKG